MSPAGAHPSDRARDLPAGLLRVGIWAAVVAAVVATIAIHRAPWTMLDLRVYHWGGTTVWHGHNVYDQYDALNYGLPFTYTPMALMCFMVMALLPLVPLIILVTAASVAALGIAIYKALGIAGFPRSRGRTGLTLLLTVASFWLEPVQQNLGFGQVNVLLMLLVVTDLSLPDQRRGKGVLIGLATGFKLVPGIFVLYLLVTRRFRAAAVSAGTAAATVAAGFLLLPSESHRYWVDGLFADSTRVGGVAYVGNQSVQGTLARLLKLGTNLDKAKPYWYAIGIVILAVGLGIAAWAVAQGEELIGISVTALVGLLVSPISWSHHWVWMAIVLTATVTLALRHRPFLYAVPILLFFLFAAYPMTVEGNPPGRPMGIIWSVPFRDNREWHWTFPEALVGNLYVIIGLLLLVGAALWLARERGRRATALRSPLSAPPVEAVER